jgi:hypothetical protein
MARTLLDLFRDSDKDREYKSPNKTPMSEGIGVEGSKNIDGSGLYYTNEYKYGFNVPNELRKQRGKDLTPMSLGNDDGGVKNIDTSGLYYTSEYKYGTNYKNIIKNKPVRSNFVSNIKSYADQERNGLRIKAAKGVISLYGTDIIRIKNQKTNLIDDMKKSTLDPRPAATGRLAAIGNFADRLKDKIGDILGFPEIPIPTWVVEQGTDANGSGGRLFTPNSGKEQNTMKHLADIRKDAAGSLVGKFLAQNARGTPSQIKQQMAGGLASASKKAVRGSRWIQSDMGENEPARNMDQGMIYGSGTGPVMANVGFVTATRQPVIRPMKRNDYMYSITMENSTQYDSIVSPLLDVKEDREQKITDSVARVKGLADTAPKPSDAKKITPPPLNLNKKPNIGSSPTTLPKVPKFTPGNTQVYGTNEDDGEYSYSQTIENNIQRESVDSDILFGRSSDLDGKSNNWLDDAKLSYSGYNAFNFKRKNDRDVDYLENSNGYKYKKDLIKIFDKGRIINDENIDTIIVKIGDIRFHFATITGISENLSPSWTGFRMIGSPFSSYMYDSIERTVQFSLKLYASNPKDHKQNWDNINKLTKLVYPLDYIGDTVGAIRPPITNLTLGDMYINKFGFIESLSYQVDDESPWELGRGQVEIDEYAELFNKTHSSYGGPTYDSLKTTDSVAWDAVQGLAEVVNYKLPKMIDISVTFKFIESRNDTEKAVIYAFKPAT